ncbi:magnesium transporter CorA family protein [uncultured Brevibacillus sp.]|uniref:magnesium transporter CorA family protein n=1 Tax=uncultured Brevibacillus sp. TaxID=169970 RepID=UPI002593957B|nr:magnesium transporter CorA family protein [uncultured Brevibacillus sp.]
MLNIYRSNEFGDLVERTDFEKGCWVHLTEPTQAEIQHVCDAFAIDQEFFRDALDEGERARIEKDKDCTMLIVEIPVLSPDDKIRTIPLGIAIQNDCFITICLTNTPILEDFVSGRVKHFHTFMKTRFVLQILYRIAFYYLLYLKQINQRREKMEKALHKSVRNKELFSLLEIEKSLVYFTTALTKNNILLEKLFNGSYLKIYEEDKELLEDVMIETRQAIAMTEVYSSIMSSMMNAFASVISNNVNHVVKILTAITIVLALPTMIASIYGMNVELPLQHDNHAFFIIMLLSLVSALVTSLIFWKKKYF